MSKVQVVHTRLLTAWIATTVALSMSLPTFGADWGTVPARDNRATVLIRTNWLAKDGPQSGFGTGFVISNDGHILTVAHQFPADVSVMLFTGETEGWPSKYQRQSFTLKLAHIDRDADFAVLTPIKPAFLTAVPVSWTWSPAEGAAVNVRGFPLGGQLEGMPGVVSRGGASLVVPTNVLLRAGYSGAPVYDSTGTVVCMARGGAPVADVKDPTVMGLGFCVPLSLLKPKVPDTIVKATAQTGMVAMAQTGPPNPPEIRSGEIRLSYSINETKETQYSGILDLAKPESTEGYTTGRIEAQKGYRIVRYEYVEHSATKVSERQVKVEPDGSSLEMTYKLTSGPGISRWRGWLAATLVTIQVPKE